MIQIRLPELKRLEVIAQNTPGCISFSQGALRIGGIPKEIKEHMKDVLSTDQTDYYQPGVGMMALREKLARTLSAQHNISLSAQNIIVSHGGIGAITTICATLLDAGDEVIIPEPAYPPYKNVVSICKANPVFVTAYDEVQDSSGEVSWPLNIQKIKDAITTKTKMIIIANPSNPTGSCLTAQDLIDLKNLCEKNEIYLVSDEVYDNYVFTGQLASATPLVCQSKFVIRTGSFSKSLAMSGWRIGYLVANADIIMAMSGVQDALIVCPSVFGQHSVLYALDHPEFLNRHHAGVSKSRDIICGMLQPLMDKEILVYSKPMSGFYLYLRSQHADSTELVISILEKAKVAMVPGKDFGPSSGRYMRLCFARSPEIVQEGSERLLKYFGL